ncbi:hypothetical protein GCM10023166_18860 [Paeniglutamicibacter cryotolerans]
MTRVFAAKVAALPAVVDAERWTEAFLTTIMVEFLVIFTMGDVAGPGVNGRADRRRRGIRRSG